MAGRFSPAWSCWWDNGERTGFKISRYNGTGTSSVEESDQRWSTREEAQAAADRANSGDMTGLTFSLFSDD